MSITSGMLRCFHSAGASMEDCIEVARAMERGPDAGLLLRLYDTLIDSNADVELVSDAVLDVARAINERNEIALNRLRPIADKHSGKKDSNRSRRGISDSHWRKLRSAILERDMFLCTYCGAGEDLTCDHIVPLVRGGTNDPENLVTACRSCNSSKGDRLLEDWLSQ